jgi:hypothetical protein
LSTVDGQLNENGGDYFTVRRKMSRRFERTSELQGSASTTYQFLESCPPFLSVEVIEVYLAKRMALWERFSDD